MFLLVMLLVFLTIMDNNDLFSNHVNLNLLNINIFLKHNSHNPILNLNHQALYKSILFFLLGISKVFSILIINNVQLVKSELFLKEVILALSRQINNNNLFFMDLYLNPIVNIFLAFNIFTMLLTVNLLP